MLGAGLCSAVSVSPSRCRTGPTSGSPATATMGAGSSVATHTPAYARSHVTPRLAGSHRPAVRDDEGLAAMGYSFCLNACGRLGAEFVVFMTLECVARKQNAGPVAACGPTQRSTMFSALVCERALASRSTGYRVSRVLASLRDTAARRPHRGDRVHR
jgi:hypothetical protein